MWIRDQKCFKVIVSRDVIFDEARKPCKDNNLTVEPEPDPLKDVENQVQVEIGSHVLDHVSV